MRRLLREWLDTLLHLVVPGRICALSRRLSLIHLGVERVPLRVVHILAALLAYYLLGRRSISLRLWHVCSRLRFDDFLAHILSSTICLFVVYAAGSALFRRHWLQGKLFLFQVFESRADSSARGVHLELVLLRLVGQWQLFAALGMAVVALLALYGPLRFVEVLVTPFFGRDEGRRRRLKEERLRERILALLVVYRMHGVVQIVHQYTLVVLQFVKLALCLALRHSSRACRRLLEQSTVGLLHLQRLRTVHAVQNELIKHIMI